MTFAEWMLECRYALEHAKPEIKHRQQRGTAAALPSVTSVTPPAAGKLCGLPAAAGRCWLRGI